MPMKTMAVYIEYFQLNNFIAVFGKKVLRFSKGLRKKGSKSVSFIFCWLHDPESL